MARASRPDLAPSRFEAHPVLRPGSHREIDDAELLEQHGASVLAGMLGSVRVVEGSRVDERTGLVDRNDLLLGADHLLAAFLLDLEDLAQRLDLGVRRLVL